MWVDGGGRQIRTLKLPKMRFDLKNDFFKTVADQDNEKFKKNVFYTNTELNENSDHHFENMKIIFRYLDNI